MNAQDAALLFVALFPFSLVVVGVVTMIRKRLKKAPKLELVKEPQSKPKKRKSKRGKRK